METATRDALTRFVRAAQEHTAERSPFLRLKYRMESRMARRWLEPPLWLARRLLTRAVLAGLAPGLAAIVVWAFALGLSGLGWDGLFPVIFSPFMIAQAPLIACLDYGADEKSALPGRIAKPMLRWSVVARLAPFLLVVAAVAWPQHLKGGLGWLSDGFLGATLIQAPALALLNLALAVWGSWGRDPESEEGWRWVVWGFAAVGASLSGVLGLARLERLADALLAWFAPGTTLPEGPLLVRVVDAQREPLREDPGWLMVAVRIHWFCDVG